LVGSVQLVGIAIIVFVKETEVEDFRGFQIMKRKTAASGFAGNKGALAARFEYVYFDFDYNPILLLAIKIVLYVVYAFI
jgi:hypothetical protein